MPIRCFFDGKCPRKDPPTGVVAITPGSRLVLSCSGHVKVDGVKVVLNSSNKRRPASVRHATTQKGPSNAVVPTKNDQTSLLNPVNERNLSPTAETGVSSEQDKYTVSPLTVHPASMSKMMMDGFDWEDKEMESNDDEVEEGKGSRVTRGVKPRPEWTWNKQLVQKGDTNQGEVTFLNHGTSLSLESVRLTDAGQYTCHHRGTETFTVKLVVADPPETPSLSCYKKSPRSTIHCEWRPRKPITKLPSSYLLLSKGKPDNFHQIPCSYSSQRSLWSCALEQNENELRIPHVASLCVSSFVGNTTSPLFFFKPLDILKPDPPSDVKTHQLEQQEKKIKVTWNLPLTWSKQDNFYDIIYEIRYRPLTSVNNLVCKIKSNRFYIIADALPGVEYLIQLRTKEEYDGLWSEWSSPVYARSWTAESVEGGFPTPTIDLLTLDLGSGLPNDNYPDGSETDSCSSSDYPYMSHHVIWISVVFASVTAILAIYIFRHKDKLMSKFHKLHQITQLGDPPPSSPSLQAASERQTLVTFDPQLYKKRPPSDTQEKEENEEKQLVTGRTEALTFNNTSYFFLRRD
uniref:Interleukin 6 receptor n=7 Tax=Nothobranchius TaxID=28779 RepID=A0A1A8AF04_NOTFU